MLAIAAATVLALASSAAAHGGVTGIVIDGLNYTGWQPYNAAQGQVSAERPYASYNPILNATDPTIHCNDDGTAGPSPQTITVAAGSNVTVTYTQWTHLPGPYQVYLAACPSSGCDAVNTGSLSWFKIDEMGLISGTWANGTWANGILLNTLQWTAQIPTNLLPGNYMSRWETIAIHQANTPQFYPECVQFQVTGSGTAFPPSSYIVNFPGAYSMSDPGLDIDIYSLDAETETTYLIPGPRVWPGFNIPPPANLPGGSTSPSSPATPTTPVTTPTTPVTTSTTTTTPTTSTTTTTPTTSTTSTPPPASTGTVAKYGQCGGQGYTGPTTCAAGSTCTVSNPFYSQCV